MREMKDSSVAWIGEMPANWSLHTIGSLFRVRNEKVSDKDYEPLSVSRGGVVPQMENVAKTDANDNRKLVLKDDFAINSRSDRKQSCGVSPLDGSVSLINTVLYLAPTAPMNVAYPNLLMKNYGFAEEFYRWGHGIVADLWTTRWQEMKSILLPVPSVDEQQRIFDRVISETQKVAELIANQEAQIEKLKAYKQSLITEVVTKGLDPTVPMKDSGVDWIGEIPDGWSVLPLKSICEFGKGLPITKADLTPEGIQVVSYGQIHSKQNSGTHLNQSLVRYVSEKYLSSNDTSLGRQGDIFFADTSEDYDGIGNAVLIDTSTETFAGYHTIIARPSTPQNSKFLAYLFLTDMWRSQLRCLASGIKVFSVTQSMLKRVSVIMPEEGAQKLIVEYLDEKCSHIDRLIAIKQSKIEKLNDYKKSLIYEYVTGKKEAI